jgi:hypothetical protein
VCQDASGQQTLVDRLGHPVQVLVVADGHGGQRYSNSDVGSRLACQLALKILADQFSQWSSNKDVEIQRWRRWLASSFAKDFHQQWLAAVNRHWKQESTKQGGPEESFSALSYGTTIGVLIMTPAWWGHTGLGDWDLVRIGPGGDVDLVNQEEDELQAGGESTYSLCLSNASTHFATRTAIYPITEKLSSFSLLLSTDGIRKSCSTDEDFFAIARYLCEGGQPRVGAALKDLNADLDRISRQGCGDDVSVAIGRWLVTDQVSGKGIRPQPNQRLKRTRPIIDQPQNINLNSEVCPTDKKDYSVSNDGAVSTSSAQELVSVRKAMLITGGLVLLSAVGIAAFNWFRPGAGNVVGIAGGTFEVTPELKTVLQQEANALCALNQTKRPSRDFGQRSFSGFSGFDGTVDDQLRVMGDPRTDLGNSDSGTISNDFLIASLDQRKSIFKALVGQSKTPIQYLSKPSRDPLSALIAWNFIDANSNGGSAFSRRSAVDLCPKLRKALTFQWERAANEHQLSILQDRTNIRNSALTIADLYKGLSAKDFEKARSLYSAAVEDQFRPEFFRQFNVVIADDLAVISNRSGVLEIEGVITFDWGDGIKQIEKRLFVVDANQIPPIIIESKFVDIVDPRGLAQDNIEMQ